MASQRRVLVVDDIPANRIIAEAMLRQLGWAVATASDGREALRALGASSFDLRRTTCYVWAIMMGLSFFSYEICFAFGTLRNVFNGTSFFCAILQIHAGDFRNNLAAFLDKHPIADA